MVCRGVGCVTVMPEDGLLLVRVVQSPFEQPQVAHLPFQRCVLTRCRVFLAWGRWIRRAELFPRVSRHLPRLVFSPPRRVPRREVDAAGWPPRGRRCCRAGVQGLGTLRSPRGPARRPDGPGGRRTARRNADSVAVWSSRGTGERGELFGTQYRIPKRCHARVRSMSQYTSTSRCKLRTNRGSPRRGAAESEWSRAPG